MSRRSFLAAVLVTSLVVGVPSAGAAEPAAPPATNGELLFLRSTEGRRALYRVEPDGSGREELQPLAGDLLQHRPLDVSPDGRRLLWTAHEPVAGSLSRSARLQVSNADGRNRTTILDLGEQVDLTMATWSPDGLAIAYLADHRLWIVDAEGGDPRRVPTPPGILRSLHWSPAGGQLALIADDRADDPERGTQVWVLDTDGASPRVVDVMGSAAPAGWEPTEVRWSPDGTSLATLIEDPWALDCTFRAIRVVRADGTGGRTVAVDPPFTCHVRRVTWSPDGAHLAVQAAAYDEDVYLHRFPAAGGPRTQLTGPRPGTFDQLATWRPVPDLLAAACPPHTTRPTRFPDVTGPTHARAIDCVAGWGIAEGRGDGSFDPEGSVTRGQLASFVVRMLEAAGGELSAPEQARFDDLAGSVHAERIEQLAEAGIVQGVATRTFAPERPVTRAQMAAFLARAEAWRTGRPLPAVPDAFSDDDGHALRRDIDRVAAVGITTGIDATRFGPGATVTRAQMATFLARLLDRAVRDGGAVPAR